MSPSPQKTRLTALDGLRGLSSLLVLATHLKLDTQEIVGQIGFVPLRFLVRTVLNTGNISVGFFFILCGFLMAYLYENPKSYLLFVQKRYSRIFTVFLVAVTISFAVMQLGIQSTGMLVLLIVVVPLVFKLGYITLHTILKTRFLFWFFIFIISSQAVIAFANYFIVFRMGAEEFYSLPKVVYTSFMYATNYTLTFIFGDYIPMVDGGYWSLVSEVMFYLVYPLVAWFLIQPMQKLSKHYWVLWYLASMICAYGLSLLFKNLLAFDTAHIHFAHFFTVGMMIALAYKSNFQPLDRLISFFQTPVGQFASILAYVFPVASAFWLGYIENQYTAYVVTFGLAPFMALAVIAVMGSRNSMSRLFSTKLFVFLGAISYPLYVIHSPIVHVLWNSLQVETNMSNVAYYLPLVIVASLAGAYYLHKVIESFYFAVTNKYKQDNQAPSKAMKLSGRKLLVGSLILCLVSVFIAFQKDFSLLSLVQSHDNTTLTLPTNKDSTYSLFEHGVFRGKFLANDNKMGIVMLSLKHIGAIHPDRSIQESLPSSVVRFRIREAGSKEWHHESQHTGWKISADEPYPFGFPEIADSKGKWYEFELSSEKATVGDHMLIIKPQENFRSVYKMSRSMVMREPLSMVRILQNKIYGAFSQPEAQTILLIYFFTIVFIVYVNRRAALAQN